MSRTVPPQKSLLASTKRIAALLTFVLAVVMSLLTFSSGIVAMSAGWLAAYTLMALRGKPAAWLLAAWGAIVVVKRVDWPFGLWCLMCLAGLIVAASVVKRASRRRFPAVAAATVWCGWIAFAVSSYRATHHSGIAPLPQDRPMVCVGDSLTSYTPQGGYPELLAKMVSLPVVNFGQPGVTSTEALKTLPEVTAARPCAMVLELGGHDFLRDASLLKTASRAELKRNLEAFIAAAKSMNAQVFLMEVPRGFISDAYAGLERELAREHDLELISDTTFRRFVLSSPAAPPGMWLGGPYFSDDGLHPNARGNALLAKQVLLALEGVYGKELGR